MNMNIKVNKNKRKTANENENTTTKTYEISAPALKFLPPNNTMDVTFGSWTAFSKLIEMCFLVDLERGFNGLFLFLLFAVGGGLIEITWTVIIFTLSLVLLHKYNFN